MSNILNLSYKVIPLLASLSTVGCVTAPVIDTGTIGNTVDTIKCQQVDREIAKNLKMSFKNSAYNKSVEQATNLGVVKNANSNIKNLFTSYTQTGSFECNFPLATKAGLILKKSDDKKLRVFAWDERNGGTMHDYAGFYQLKDKQGNVHLQNMNISGSINSLNSFPNALFTDTLNGKTTYMMVSTEVLSTKHHFQFLNAFTINGNKIQPANIIRTNSIGSGLSFNYDFFSVVDRPERPIQLFEYNKSTKTIRFPVVVKNNEFSDGKVTNKFIEYKFDGAQFMRVKN